MAKRYMLSQEIWHAKIRSQAHVSFLLEMIGITRETAR